MLSQISAAILFFIVSAQSALDAETLRDGQILSYDKSSATVWDGQSKSALNIEEFWQAYAKRGGGKYWGRSRDYPPYDEVNEFDTLLIELSSGVCLMEFFHSRWRRANAVRRWDERYDEYSGCPKVFD